MQGAFIHNDGPQVCHADELLQSEVHSMGGLVMKKYYEELLRMLEMLTPYEYQSVTVNKTF